MAGPLEIVIRSPRREDIPAIVGIYNHYVEHSPCTFETAKVRWEDRIPWWEQHSHGGRHRLLVADDPTGRMVGWASTSAFRDRAAYATTVEASAYIHPGAVNRRVGSRIYEALFKSIQEEDVELMVAGVTLPNPASLALHRRFGFIQAGVFHRVGRKFGRYRDVEWLERPLHESVQATLRTAGAWNPL